MAPIFLTAHYNSYAI